MCGFLDRVARAQAGHSGAEMRFRRVPELGDERVAFKRLLNDAALHAAAAAVNQAHLAQPAFRRRADVLLDNRLDITRRKGVQVQRVFNRDADAQGVPST